MLRRIRQFTSGLFARVSKDDYTFLSDYVTLAERELFLKMPRYDQTHSIGVGGFLRRRGATLEVVRAGLLHDVGKGETPDLTLVRRSVCVVLERIAPDWAGRKMKDRGSKLGRALYLHLNHAEIGARMLEKVDTDERIVELVRYHHDKMAMQDPDLKMLKEADKKV